MWFDFPAFRGSFNELLLLAWFIWSRKIMVIEKDKPVGLPESRHDDRVGGKGSKALRTYRNGMEL